MQPDNFLEGRRTWGWISAIFAAQTVGALIIWRLFGLDYSEVFIPVSVLALGAFVSFGFRSLTRSRELGAWQWWVPVILYAVFIFSLSNRSYPGAIPAFSTKIFHPIEYAVLGLLLCVAWFSILARKGVSSFAVRVYSLGILYGATDEFHQAFVPGRSPRVIDVLFWDLLGITLAFGTFLLVRRIWMTSAVED
jgi:VanZ family protein